jgi:hypothetical protein
LTTKRGYFLPPFKNSKKKDRVITFDYLFGVFKGENYAPVIQNILQAPPVTKQIDSKAIVKQIELITGKKFNFSAGRAPNKHWLVTVLYNLDKDDDLFKDDSEESKDGEPTISLSEA